MAIVTGENFGPYRIIEPLGRGGMATVYKAYEAALDRYVALKVLPAEFLHEETFAARFQREAKVIAKLEHPNIIPIFAFGIEQGIPWMSMRLIRGGSLSGLLNQGRLPRGRAVVIVRAVADALTYAHAQGVVHRDVKPQNILVDDQGGIYLADFGIARIVEGGTAITRTGFMSGTPQYMAPEQATGHTPDHRVDIYALGVVAYELLTGSPPFAADTPVAVLMKQVSAPIPIPNRDLVPESMIAPLMKSLAKSPDERWQTAAEFAKAIEKGAAAAPTAVAAAVLPSSTRTIIPVPAPPVLRPDSKPPPRRAGSSVQSLSVVAGLGLLVVGGAVAAWWMWPRAETAQETSGAPVAPMTSPPVLEPAVSPPAAVTPAEVPRVTATPSVATPTDAASTRSVRPVPEVRPTAPPRATTAAVPSPIETSPAPAMPTTTMAAPRALAGPAFHLNERTTLAASTVGPVTLVATTFKQSRPDEIEALLDFYCEKGKDQEVTYEVALLDAKGAVVLTIKGKKGIEEKDKMTFKQKQKVAPGLLDEVRTFKVTFTSVPD